MGLNLSNQYTQNTVESFNEVINSTVNSVAQNLQTTCSASNVFKGNYGIYPTVIDANGQVRATAECSQNNISSLNISQTASNSCSIEGGLTNQINENLTTTLSNNINTWMTQTAQQNNGWISIGLNIAASEAITQEELSNRIANTISSNLNQTCSAFLQASNFGEIYVCGNYPNGIYVTQNAVGSNLTTCIINNSITAITNDSVLNDIVTKTTQQVSQTNEGLSTIAKWLIIGGVIIGVLIILGVILFLVFSGSGSKQEVNPAEQRKRELQRELILEKLQGEEGGSVSSVASEGVASEGGESESTLGRLARMGGEYFSRREEV